MFELDFSCQNIKTISRTGGSENHPYAKAAKSESIKDKDIIAINQTHIL